MRLEMHQVTHQLQRFVQEMLICHVDPSVLVGAIEHQQ